jgi:hypothetical protein
MLALAVGITMAGAAPSRGGAQVTEDAAGYVWADACKDCHKEIHEAWSRTKHQRALERLNGDERKRDCAGCHVTGAKTLVEKNSKVVNGGVQCEACHGPGEAHVKDPWTKGKVRREPGEAACIVCHNERSPHYKYFHYKGMAAFSHKVG